MKDTDSGEERQRMRLPSDGDSSGRDLGRDELDRLREVIESGTLNCTKGRAVKEFEARFAKRYGVEFGRATTSGTASIHAAIAAVDPEPGDEIITSPITDIGALSPIIYQTAIPVFADVDPLTYNVTAETIAPRITRRTRAIIVTHLFGNPCDMGPILDLARKHELPVIEDAAQAYEAECDGQLVGTIGDFGCFSLQQGKHMTTGEGGIVITRNEKYWRRLWLFVDKAWGYGDPAPDHYFLALNYRMTELQGAVALAQLEKLGRRRGEANPGRRDADRADRRHRRGSALRSRLPAASTPTGSTRCASTTDHRGRRRRVLGPARGARACSTRRATSRSRPSCSRSSASGTPSGAAAFPSKAPIAKGCRR